MTGWATVAAGPVVLPFSALGVIAFDANGTGTGSIDQVLAGQAMPQTTVTAHLTVNKDCTLTWTATCSFGCTWSGTGFYSKFSKEINLLFKGVGQGEFPVTAIAVLKQL
jgi:uncharacterized protein (AIM24 family)